MKKLILTFCLIAATAISLATASFVYAQNSNLTNQPFPAWMQNMMNQDSMIGRGGMMGLGMMGGKIGAMHNIMHEDMVAALAERLDLSVEEINQRLNGGEIMFEIAEEAGLSEEAFTTWMLQAKKASLRLAVEDGVISQQQADWMLDRMEQMLDSGYRPSSCHGRGFGSRSNSTY
jgi:hypothetical protein